jgi:hypothetical protein
MPRKKVYVPGGEIRCLHHAFREQHLLEQMPKSLL